MSDRPVSTIWGHLDAGLGKLRGTLGKLRKRKGPDTPSAPTRKRRARPDLVLAALLASLGLLVCLALVAAHFVVSGRLLRSWVNGDPEKLLLEYESASAWVPGVVQVSGLRLRGRDPNVEWYLRMESARVSFSLLDLLARRFHATAVRARGMTFRLRLREERKQLSMAHAAMLPPIPGFADPALKEEDGDSAGGPAPPRSWSGGKPWGVVVDNLLADPVPDLWIEMYRFRGRARVTGGFLLRPREYAAVGPAAIEFESGRLTLGGETLLASASGRTDCVIEAYDPRRVRGNAVWPKISGSFRLAGRVETVRFVNYFLRNSREPRLGGGEGAGRMDMKVEQGIGRGQLVFSGKAVEARYGQADLRGDVSVRARIPRWDFEHNALDVSGTHIELRGVSSRGHGPDARDWWGRFDLKRGEIRRGLRTAVTTNCRDARPLFVLFNTRLPGWAEGLLKLEGLAASAGVTLDKSLVEVDDFDASGGAFRIFGRYRSDQAVRRGAFLLETGPLSVGVDIRGDKSAVKLIGARRWYEEKARSVRAGRLRSPVRARDDHFSGSSTTAVP